MAFEMCAVDEADAHGLVLMKQWLNRAGKVSWLLSLDDWTLAAVQLSPASIIIQWRELITSPSRIALGICLHLTTIHQVVGCQPHPLHHAHSHGIQLSCQNVRVWPGLRARSANRSNPPNNCLTWYLELIYLLLPFSIDSEHWHLQVYSLATKLMMDDIPNSIGKTGINHFVQQLLSSIISLTVPIWEDIHTHTPVKSKNSHRHGVWKSQKKSHSKAYILSGPKLIKKC